MTDHSKNFAFEMDADAVLDAHSGEVIAVGESNSLMHDAEALG